MTGREQAAWFNSYVALGRAMGITDIPAALDDLRTLRERIEAERMVYAPSNRIIADATLDLLLGMYVPRWLYWLGRPVLLALCDDQLVTAIGRTPQRVWVRGLVAGAMGLRRRALRLLPERWSLRLITRRRTPTYPKAYTIAGLGTFAPGDAGATVPPPGVD